MVLEYKQLLFNIKRVYFCDYPLDVDGCDAVHFFFCKNKVEAKGFTCQSQLTAVIDLTQDLETIWRNMDKNCRQDIRRAEREQIKHKLNQDYDEFYQMNKRLVQTKSFAQKFGFVTPSVEIIRRYGTLFTAELGGEVVAGSVCLEDEEHILGWLSASKRFEVDKHKRLLIGSANRMLQWEAMKYAKAKGIREFNWGGMFQEGETDGNKQGINAFKLSFGSSKVEHCYLYRKVYSKRYRLAQRIYHSIQLVRRTS